jgi:small-conductance mechanosensitive channel
MTDSYRALLWGIGLAAAFPLLSILLAEVTLRLRRGNHASAAPVVLIHDLILPAMATLVLMVRVIGWGRPSTPVRVVETVVWLFVITTALSFINALMFRNAKQGSWRAKMPRLFIDMARVVIVLVCLAIILSAVWKQDLGKLVAALGVGSLVLGLALQEPLGNLFSGIMLMMERPVGIGDWVKVGDNLGAVIETNWRSVHLRTRDGDLVVMPNSMLAKGSFVNYGRASPLHSESVMLRFSCDDPPNKVKLVLLDAATRTQGVIEGPGMKVRLHHFGDSSIEYEVKLPMIDFGRLKDIVEEFRTLVWYAAKRDGLTMPYPIHTHIVVPRSKLEAAEQAPLPVEMMEAFAHLGLAGAVGPQTVSRSAVKHYARGEQVAKEGQRLAGLHLIVRGRVALSARNASGQQVEIARLERGEFFGEKSLQANSPSEATVTALEDLEVVVLEGDVAQSLVERTPYLSRQISDVLESRRKALHTARAGAAE